MRFHEVWWTTLKCRFCNKLLLYEWNSGQFNIFVIIFGWVCCCTHPKVTKKVFNWPDFICKEVTSYKICILTNDIVHSFVDLSSDITAWQLWNWKKKSSSYFWQVLCFPLKLWISVLVCNRNFDQNTTLFLFLAMCLHLGNCMLAVPAI